MAPSLQQKAAAQAAPTAAEQVVARMDSYTQEQHLKNLGDARDRIEARKEARRARARAAAARLRTV